MSTQNQPPTNPTVPLKKLTFTPQTEEENQLTQTIKQYASIEGIQIHDLLLDALLHIAVDKNIFGTANIKNVKKPKCAMRGCKEEARYEALYKLDNTIKLLCFCHGNSIAVELQKGSNNKLWAYSRPISEASA